jgi:hypothetical protein
MENQKQLVITCLKVLIHINETQKMFSIQQPISAKYGCCLDMIIHDDASA